MTATYLGCSQIVCFLISARNSLKATVVNALSDKNEKIYWTKYALKIIEKNAKQVLIFNKNELIWILIIILPTEVVDKAGYKIVETIVRPCYHSCQVNMMIFCTLNNFFFRHTATIKLLNWRLTNYKKLTGWSNTQISWLL